MMHTPERLEKTRQAIMRYHELLEIMEVHLNEGKKAYERLFANVSEDIKSTLSHKDLQSQIAPTVASDANQLERAVLHMRFCMMNLEKDFDQLHSIILTEDIDE